MQHNPQGPQQPQGENEQRFYPLSDVQAGQNQSRWGAAPPPVQPPKPKGNRGRLVAEIVGGIVLLLMGVGIGGAGDSAPVAAPAPTATRTVTEQVPGPVETVEVEVPGPETTVTVTAKPPKPKGPSGTIPGDGLYLVGKDIKAGTYRAANESGSCYWERLSGTSGDFDDILANDNASGPVVVTIRSSDEAFSTQRCGSWERIS